MLSTAHNSSPALGCDAQVANFKNQCRPDAARGMSIPHFFDSQLVSYYFGCIVFLQEEVSVKDPMTSSIQYCSFPCTCFRLFSASPALWSGLLLAARNGRPSQSSLEGTQKVGHCRLTLLARFNDLEPYLSAIIPLHTNSYSKFVLIDTGHFMITACSIVTVSDEDDHMKANMAA